MNLIPPFDHVPSALVDVIVHPDGKEFVQVWGAGKRGVLLSYFRGPTGVSDIQHTVPLEGGPWRFVETIGAGRTLHYLRTSALSPRSESFLPSGRLLVHDVTAGISLERLSFRGFNFGAWGPVGKPLGIRALAAVQHGGTTWFMATRQRVVNDDEQVVSDAIVLVEEWCGGSIRRRVEREAIPLAGT